MLREGLQAKKHSLKPAVTIVTLQDGSKWEEEHQGARQRCLTVDSPQQDREPFFVEGKEDPIPYKVRHRLFVGSQDAAITSRGRRLCLAEGVKFVLNLLDNSAPFPEVRVDCRMVYRLR